jgi:hypothetical protein
MKLKEEIFHNADNRVFEVNIKSSVLLVPNFKR